MSESVGMQLLLEGKPPGSEHKPWRAICKHHGKVVKTLQHDDLRTTYRAGKEWWESVARRPNVQLGYSVAFDLVE